MKQFANNIPAELRALSRWIPVGVKNNPKCPACQGWQLAANQTTFNAVRGNSGFVCSVHPDDRTDSTRADYLLLDFDHVLDGNGNFVNEDAKQCFNFVLEKLSATGNVFCEYSMSGNGFHVLACPTPRKYRFAGQDDGTVWFGKHDTDDERKACPKLEIFVGSEGRQVVLTGNLYHCDENAKIPRGESVDALLDALALKISEQDKQPALDFDAVPVPSDSLVTAFANAPAKESSPAQSQNFRHTLNKKELETLKNAVRVIPPEYIADRLHFGHDKKDGYVCPHCGNGSGSDGTGIKPSYLSGHYEWYCYKCNKNWDNAALIAECLGLSLNGRDFIDSVNKIANMFGIGYTHEGEFVSPAYIRNFTPPKEEQKPVKDYTNFYNNVARPNLPKFLEQCGGSWRGFTRETLAHFFCGYTDDFILYHAPAVIIPYTKNHYFARFVGDKDKLTAEQKKSLHEKYHTTGAKTIFNIKRALGNDNPICFVVESATDAMSIYQASGYNVIAVSGSNLSAFMREQLKPYAGKKFIVMLDGDATGQSKKQKLVDQLIELGHKATAITLSDDYKDANDFLQADPKGLAARLVTVYEAATEFFANAPATKPAATPDKPAQVADPAVEEWQKINGVINPDTLTTLVDGKKYLDELQIADITPGVAKSPKTKQALALCTCYDCYAEAFDFFFSKVEQAKRAADYELKTKYQDVQTQPLELVAIKNISITEIKTDVLSMANAYKKAHKEYVKSEKQRLVREEVQRKQAARAVEMDDLRKRLEKLKTQDQCRERDSAIVESIKELCTWKHDKAGNPVSVEATQANADLIFGNDPDIDGLFAYDEFQQHDVFLKAPPWNNRIQRGDEWQDADDDQLCVTLRRIYTEFIHEKITAQTFTTFSRKRSFHTIQEYFKNLPAWDGKPRAETLFIDWLKVDDTAFAREVTMNWLTAAVARIFHPGCRYQTALVLPGNQGIGKSFILERLGGAWHDTLTDAIDDPHALDAIRKMWICEIKEGAAWKKADADAQKRFIDTAKDTRRVAYGKHATTYLRQNVIAITINGKQFLSDLTGNRRYMILQANLAQGCYVEQVRGEQLTDDNVIKQIWAEVYVHYNTLFANGFDEKKLELSREMKLQIETVAQEYTRDDDIKGELQAALDTKILPSVVWDLMTQAERRDFMVTKSFCIEEIALETRFKGLGDKKRAKLQDAFDAATTMSTFVQRADVRDKKTNLYRTHFIFYGTEYRQHICAAEVRAEFFDKADRRLTSSKILDLLEQTEGWSKGKAMKRAPEYGDQKNVYWRNPDNVPTDDNPPASPPPTDTPKPDWDSLGGEPIDPEDMPFDTAPTADTAPVVDKPVEPARHGINLIAHGWNDVEAKIPDGSEPTEFFPEDLDNLPVDTCEHAAPFDPDEVPF